jgi:hypothetical protein
MKDSKSNKTTISNGNRSLNLLIIHLIENGRLWVRKILFKRILKIQFANMRLFDLTFKNILLQKYKDKKIPYISMLSMVVTAHYLNYFNEKIPEKYLDFTQKEKEIVDNETRLVLENENLKQIISDYYLVAFFYHSSDFSPEKSKIISDECFEKSINYIKDAKPLTDELLQEKKLI